jgi:16S rRNA U1498 N3-methylase RsmE
LRGIERAEAEGFAMIHLSRRILKTEVREKG